MESNTFRNRLSQLTQKTRKALRLYSGNLSTSSRNPSAQSKEYSSMQVAEWHEITRDLLESITPLLALSNTRKITAQFYSIRDRFYNEWRLIQADLHRSQIELEVACKESDFVRCATLSFQLIKLKARMQACQAAHNELQQVIQQSKTAIPSKQAHLDAKLDPSQLLTKQQSTIASEDSEDDAVAINESSNVIPLLRKRNF